MAHTFRYFSRSQYTVTTDSPAIRLGPTHLRGRTFLLGNKRAFSLSLPAANGPASFPHAHKWFGAYLYGQKFFDGQVVRLPGTGTILNAGRQSGFLMELESARREYTVDGLTCSESFFVPDGIQGFACTLTGDLDLLVEPRLDIRFSRALNGGTAEYEAEYHEHGTIVSNTLPAGSYDDATETFLPHHDDAPPCRLYAAIEIVGNGSACIPFSPRRRQRRAVYLRDANRYRFLSRAEHGGERSDHAPLWDRSRTHVYVPAQLLVRGHATILYGFGGSREEALAQIDAMRGQIPELAERKRAVTRQTTDRTQFTTGNREVDTAFVHVLSRLNDALVARHATAEGTSLDRPATMILAGNQYFHDSWKRDENIALGYLLSLGFYDLARDVISDSWRLQDPVTGRLPQRIRAGEEPPYHSSDGTLWALWRLHQYWRCTGDRTLVDGTMDMVRLFFRRGLERAVHGLLPSGRTSSPDYLWETWMDTPHTPRDGYPIEIQMLWLACLRAFIPLVAECDPALAGEMQATEILAREMLARFSVRGMPADSLDSDFNARDLITPNPYFCFGLGLELEESAESMMRRIGRHQLAGRQGIRTLAPSDWPSVFPREFLDDRRHVRGRGMRSVGKFNYHRGVEWNWLSQFFVAAELKYGEPDVAYRTYVRKQVLGTLCHAGIGGISELHDLGGTRGPEFQAWSMSGLLEALQAFAGVTVDVPGRRISVQPQLPRDWPYLCVRKWYGGTPLDIHHEGPRDAQSLTVVFPDGAPPDVRLDLAFLIPEGHEIDIVDVRLDGLPGALQWDNEPIPGSKRSRVRLSVPASGRIDVRLKSYRAAARHRGQQRVNLAG